jgi:uncharacterized protein (TIGR00661 family)
VAQEGHEVKIIYGVVGEGMGHATRSRVVLEHLLSRGHEIRVVVSGRAHGFLVDRFRGRAGIAFDEIHGLRLAYEGSKLDVAASVLENLREAPRGLRCNLEVYGRVADDFAAEAVVSDFESWAYLYGLTREIPVISIDNMQVLNRCAHDEFVTDDRSSDYRLAKAAVKIKLPGAFHYLVSSFFYPPVRKRRTTLVPPILRPEILSARHEPGHHILVYQTSAANQALLPLLERLPQEFRVYGLGRNGREGNVTLCAFDEHRFIDDLRTAAAVIAGGGFSLMCEAVHLHVPMLSCPIDGQYEQELNARYLQQLGYGRFTRDLDEDVIEGFLSGIDEMRDKLQSYVPTDNTVIQGCLDELLEDIRRGGSRPQQLRAVGLPEAAMAGNRDQGPKTAWRVARNTGR